MATLLDALPATTLNFIQAQKQREFLTQEAELQRQATRQLQESRIAAQLEQQGLIDAAAMKRLEATNTAAAGRQSQADAAALARQTAAQDFDRTTQEQERALKGAIGLRKSIGGGLPTPSEVAQAQGYAATLSRLNPEDDNLRALANTSQPEAWKEFGLGMLTNNYDYERLRAANQDRGPGLQATIDRSELAGRRAAYPANNSVSAFDQVLGTNGDMSLDQQIQIAKANPEKFQEAANTLLQTNPALLSQIRGRPGVKDDSSIVSAVNGDRLVMGVQPNNNYMISPTGDLINLAPGDTAPSGYQKANNVPLTVGAGPASDPSATPMQLDIGQTMRVLNAARKTSDPDVAVAGSLKVMEDALNAMQQGLSPEEQEQLFIRAQSLDTPQGQQSIVDQFYAERDAAPGQTRDAYQRGFTQELDAQQQARLRPYQNSKALNDAMTAESLSATEAYETTTGEAGRKAAIQEERRLSKRDRAINAAVEDRGTEISDILLDVDANIFTDEFGEAYKDFRGLPNNEALFQEYAYGAAEPGTLKLAVIESLRNHGGVYSKVLFGKAQPFEALTKEQQKKVHQIALTVKLQPQAAFWGQSNPQLAKVPTPEQIKEAQAILARRGIQ
jgi:hypothetical protein